MRNIKTHLQSAVLIILMITGLTACYSLKEPTVTGDAKTVSVDYFSNRASQINPSLSQVFTEDLKDKFLKETKLNLVNGNGDLAYSGYISNYTVSPAGIQSNNQAQLNRLTITVNVKYTNKFNAKQNFETEISAYSDYPSTTPLSSVESGLIKEISDKIVQEIFNRTVTSW